MIHGGGGVPEGQTCVYQKCPMMSDATMFRTLCLIVAGSDMFQKIDIDTLPASHCVRTSA